MSDVADPLSLPLATQNATRALLGCGKTFLAEMIRDGRLTSVRLGKRKVMITTASIKALLEGRAPLPPRSGLPPPWPKGRRRKPALQPVAATAPPEPPAPPAPRIKRPRS